MKWLFLVLIFIHASARSEIVSEDFVKLGVHKIKILSVRKHKVKNGTGYSLLKTTGDGEVSGRVLSEKEYSIYLRDMKNFSNLFHNRAPSSLVSCGDVVIIGAKSGKAAVLQNSICFTNESVKTRKEFLRWWRKISS